MLIENRITNNIDAYLVQETWLTGDWEKETRGYLVTHHNHDKDKKKKKGREKRRVAIILLPCFRMAFERAGRPKQITTLKKGKLSGRLSTIPELLLPSEETQGKRQVLPRLHLLLIRD